MARIAASCLLGLWVAGCRGASNDTATDTAIGSDPAGDGWCAVASTIGSQCVVCHSAASALGDLDLETDPYAALVNVTSATYGAVLVKPGDPAGSLLMRKMDGSMSGDEGAVMPPAGILGATKIEAVRAWIAAGATEACDGPITGTPPDRYHPTDWALPGEHGMAAKFQEDDCQSCHGEDLRGGTSAISCDTCHVSEGFADWTTSCTFCHGDRASELADAPAPPEDIDDEANASAISFPEHRDHLIFGDHPQWGCTQCHAEPADVFSDGHFIAADATPGVAEVLFDAGLFADGGYNGTNGTCSGGYCHSNGQSPFNARTVSSGQSLSCNGCHGDRTNPQVLSGRHGDHEEGAECEECHATASGNSAIDEPDLHVDGVVELDLPAGMQRNDVADTCSGTCHAHNHMAAESHWFGF